MTLYEFLRTLSASERNCLAEDLEVSKGYLRQLHCDPKRLASADLARSVLESSVNKDLPNACQFTEQDYINHRQACFIRKSVGGEA